MNAIKDDREKKIKCPQYLGRETPSELEDLNVFDKVDFDLFFKKCCYIGKGSIWADKLLRVYNRYRCENKFFIPITSTTGITQYFKEKGIEITKRRNRGKVTYLGLCLNDTGSALTEHNFRDRAMIEAKKIKNLTPNNAYKLVSCNPDVLLLKKIVNGYNQKREPKTVRINLLKAKRILKDIEKICFQKNWSTFSKTKIGLALYLTTPFSYDQIKETFGLPTAKSLKVRIQRAHPEMMKYLFRYKRFLSINPNRFEKIKERKLYLDPKVASSIPEITKNYDIVDLLGSKARIRILKLLAKNTEMTISQIIRGTKLNHTSVKHHLNYLKSNNLVQEKVFGRIKIYRYKFEDFRAKSLSKFIEIWEG